MDHRLDYISEDYSSARHHFREASASAGARLTTLTVEGQSPHASPLTIDIAWLGNSKPRRIVLHSSGLHGIEGFAGSAIQRKLLSEPPAVSEDGALIFVHVLNPYRMAWLRRANESNVDLNRNCIRSGEVRSGAPYAYKHLNCLLNPPHSSVFDFFYLCAALNILRYGFKFLKKSVAMGQYEFPKGLFFGGKHLQQEPKLYKSWLAKHLSPSSVEHILVIDVHTGLGKWCQESVFVETPKGATCHEDLGASLGREIKVVSEEDSVSYVKYGGLCSIFFELFSHSKVDFIIQEFGTFHAMKMLYSLRQENVWHHSGKGGDVHHPSKQQLKEAFCPSSREWRQSILDNGVSICQKAMDFTFQ